MRLVYAVLRKRNHVLRHLELFSGRLPVKIVKTLNDRQSTLLAESLRSFLDKSRKRKEEAEKSSKCHKTWFRFLSPA